LILWRHAEAVDGFPDHERSLTAKGVRQARHMAAFLSPQLPTDTRILVSPAVRAQQTASALTSKFSTVEAIGVGASPQSVLSAADWPHEKGTTLLVGHQPWLGEVAALLMTGHAAYWSVKKGSIWWLAQRAHDGSHQTTLRLVITPEHLQT